jgi:hypothetical protein
MNTATTVSAVVSRGSRPSATAFLTRVSRELRSAADAAWAGLCSVSKARLLSEQQGVRRGRGSARFQAARQSGIHSELQ